MAFFFLYKATIAAEDNARIFFLVYVLKNHSLDSREEFFFFIGKEIRLELFTIIYPEFTGVWLPTYQQQKRLTLLRFFSRIWNFYDVTHEVGPKKTQIER